MRHFKQSLGDVGCDYYECASLPRAGELLRHYVESHDEAAFAEFVRRHLDLVYFAALRRTGGNAALAEDVAQHVFTAAAKDARSLAKHPVVEGWL